MVTGKPGIGKSVFPLRILLHRLALKLPTALQIEPNCAQLFYQGGVKEFTHLEDGPRYTPLESKCGLPGRIWALVDSNRQLVEPAPVFQQGPSFVVKASSPRPVRHEWTRDIRSISFYMKSWSFTEVLQVRSLIELVASEKKLLDFHRTYGASLESLFRFFEDPACYGELVTREAKKLSSSDSYKVFQYAADTPDISDYLISTGPLPDDRTRPERKIASKFVLEKICARVIWERVWE
ncbi:hypothetical protein BDM02DRAFT_681763 [Thelephora ganbajun]|uniref:Uncharacterized protein n=1 Tax=Thelephora ganbajun TaxID=370292 RepID=A0ACB6Z6M8_THEGA|nr:hypothetical protein BDM02DRAFT_681763 [Thelephora ganbajun]